MSGFEQNKKDKLYLKIVQGTFRQKVAEGTPGSIARPWEAGGKKGISHEIEHTAVFGRITDVGFFEGEHDGRKFTSLQVTLDENEDGKRPVISIGSNTRYAEDIMKRLPNVNFKEEVRLRPYSFTPEGEDRTITGVEIMQRDNQGNFTKKIENYFWDKDKKTVRNGYPTASQEVIDNGDWELFYKQTNRWLIKYTREHTIERLQPGVRDFGEASVDEIPEENPYHAKGDPDPKDVPF